MSMQTAIDYMREYPKQSYPSSTLSIFRFLFGGMMVFSIIRFAANGWIRKFYIDPTFHFKYFGFEFVRPLGEWTYLIFVVCGFSALAVCLGWHYRVAIISFFLSFTYIELMDKTTYLNHYYFVSVVSFLLIFIPAASQFSIDSIQKKKNFQYLSDGIQIA